MSGGEYVWPQWPAVSGVRAAFTSRRGGHSRIPYDSFNLAAHVGDGSAEVAQNRSALRSDLKLPGEPIWLEQVHGSHVIDADTLAPGAALPRADGAISRRAGTVLAVMVADCVPVLLAARDGSAVAVAHAGWRGLAAGVLEATVAALQADGPQPRNLPLQAWLGPSIGQPHFEVGPEVRAAFVARESAAAAAFVPNARGRWQCDLQALARARLESLGIGSVEADPSCSYSDSRRFYSYRRDGTTGRMAALIWLQPAQC